MVHSDCGRHASRSALRRPGPAWRRLAWTQRVRRRRGPRRNRSRAARALVPRAADGHEHCLQVHQGRGPAAQPGRLAQEIEPVDARVGAASLDEVGHQQLARRDPVVVLVVADLEAAQGGAGAGVEGSRRCNGRRHRGRPVLAIGPVSPARVAASCRVSGRQGRTGNSDGASGSSPSSRRPPGPGTPAVPQPGPRAPGHLELDVRKGARRLRAASQEWRKFSGNSASTGRRACRQSRTRMRPVRSRTGQGAQPVQTGPEDRVQLQWPQATNAGPPGGAGGAASSGASCAPRLWVPGADDVRVVASAGFQKIHDPRPGPDPQPALGPGLQPCRSRGPPDRRRPPGSAHRRDRRAMIHVAVQGLKGDQVGAPEHPGIETAPIDLKAPQARAAATFGDDPVLLGHHADYRPQGQPVEPGLDPGPQSTQAPRRNRSRAVRIRPNRSTDVHEHRLHFHELRWPALQPGTLAHETQPVDSGVGTAALEDVGEQQMPRREPTVALVIADLQEGAGGPGAGEEGRGDASVTESRATISQ